MDIDNALAYIDFCHERHRIWEQRQAGSPQPWTTDPILATRKFTNVFRVLDPGTQFFVRELMDAEPRDVLARAILYRLTNRPETWTALREAIGRYPLAEDLTETTADVLCFLRDEGMQVFSGAYMIAGSLGAKAGMDKSREAVMTSRRVLLGAWDEFAQAVDLAGRFAALRRHAGMGDFMAQQIITDYGYSTGPDEENDFVVPGPGCIKGARTIADHPAVAVIKWAQVELADITLAGRSPSLMDVQNTLCEWFKYHRYMTGSSPAAAPYRPAHPGPQPAPVLPTHWALASQAQ